LAGTFHEQEQRKWREAISNKGAREAKIQSGSRTHPPTLKKSRDEWVSGDDPMTGAQASYLKTLSEEAGDPDAYDENLTKAEASKRIDALKQGLGLE
jgi:Protein of unknown function (DUF3072)